MLAMQAHIVILVIRVVNDGLDLFYFFLYNRLSTSWALITETHTYTHVFDTTIADNNDYMNIDGESPRERSNCLSNISSRNSFTYSSISSIPYIERIEIQNNDFS